MELRGERAKAQEAVRRANASALALEQAKSFQVQLSQRAEGGGGAADGLGGTGEGG